MIGARTDGAAPRIAPLEVDEMSGDLAAIVARMMTVNAAVTSRDSAWLAELDLGGVAPDAATQQRLLVANLPEIMRTMLRHPGLFARLVDVGIELLGNGALPGRDRELAILRIAWLCRASYEWGEHVIIAKKQGIISAEIEAITTGADAPGWSEHDRAILRATEELHAEAMISDPTWAILAKRFDDRQMIELPIVIGQYQAVAYYQNTLRLRLHDGNLGLAAR